MNKLLRILLPLLLFVAVSIVYAQRERGRGRGYRDRSYNGDVRRGVPLWEVDKEFKHDTFTFVRLKYSSQGWGRGNGWQTDWPDSDLNFSLRLQQLTSMKVNPEPIILELNDEKIFDYPFLYMIEPGRIMLFDDEVESLRRYCLNGGFLMVDDFWGAYQYDTFYREIKKVFPNREPIELDLSHEIFHCVYDLKEKPQVPSINWAYSGTTWEDHGPDSREPHYRAILDDSKRVMVLICHNTDLGDGWEKEGQNRQYFEEFSVKKAYPLGINIVTYAMTH